MGRAVAGVIAGPLHGEDAVAQVDLHVGIEVAAQLALGALDGDVCPLHAHLHPLGHDYRHLAYAGHGVASSLRPGATEHGSDGEIPLALSLGRSLVPLLCPLPDVADDLPTEAATARLSTCEQALRGGDDGHAEAPVHPRHLALLDVDP